MAELSEIKSLATKAVTLTESLDERLFNRGSGVVTVLQADIQEIKDDRLREERWTRVHNILHYSLGPILVGLHEVLRKFGIAI